MRDTLVADSSLNQLCIVVSIAYVIKMAIQLFKFRFYFLYIRIQVFLNRYLHFWKTHTALRSVIEASSEAPNFQV